MKIYQLTNRSASQTMGYVVVTGRKHVIVIDGGSAAEVDELCRILLLEGGHADFWLLTHPHYDHHDALRQILKDPAGVTAGCICYSPLSDDWAENEPPYRQNLLDLNAALAASVWPLHPLRVGERFTAGAAEIEVLRVSDPSLTANAFNNASCVFRICEAGFSFLVLGDLGIEGGEQLLSAHGSGLCSDAVQMAHHGQSGVSQAVYQAVAPRLAFWPTPGWLWTNTADPAKPGQGPWQTLLVRRWMEELGAQAVTAISQTIVFDSDTGLSQPFAANHPTAVLTEIS